MAEEDNASDLAKRLEDELTGSILALWQQRLTQSSFDGDLEIEYPESEASSGPGSPSHTPNRSPHPQKRGHIMSLKSTLPWLDNNRNRNRYCRLLFSLICCLKADFVSLHAPI